MSTFEYVFWIAVGCLIAYGLYRSVTRKRDSTKPGSGGGRPGHGK